MAARLSKLLGRRAAERTEDLDDLEEDEDTAPPVPEEPVRAEVPGLHFDKAAVQAELDRVESFIRRAKALPADSKAEALVRVVGELLARPPDRRKLLVFTESLTTQSYLRDSLVEMTSSPTRTSRCFAA